MAEVEQIAVLPFMPEDIIVNILEKLQAPALSRFRCVSKQWCRLISETKTSRRKLLVKCVSEKREFSFKSIDQTTCEVEKVDVPWESKHTWIYGSCHGLMLVGFMDDLFLWNPFTRHSLKFLSYDGLSKSKCRPKGGLCFDSITNDYKVVMSPIHKAIVRGSAMVGSSRNKTWKHIAFPYEDGIQLHSGPMLNNHIHWATSKEGSQLKFYSTMIIYFDAEIEEFVDLPMPPSKEGEGDAIVGLGVLDGCLCMSRLKGIYELEVQILTMKEYGVGESWTTLFKVEGPLFSHSFVPLFYCEEGKSKVMMKIAELGSNSIITYDPSAKLRRDISTSFYLTCETVYEESLTRPNGYDWEELDFRGEAFYKEIFPSNCVRTMKRDSTGCWYVDREEGSQGEQESEEDDQESDEDFQESSSGKKKARKVHMKRKLRIKKIAKRVLKRTKMS